MNPRDALWFAAAALAAVLVIGLIWVWVRTPRGPEQPSDEAYTQALTALINGNRRRALAKFKEAVQADSENLDAYIRLGDLLRESGEVHKALAVHRDLTVRAGLTDSMRVRILESMTRDYLAARHYEEAGQSAERLLRINKQHRFALRALQEVAEALEDWPRAVSAVESRLKATSDQPAPELARYHTWVGEQELAKGNSKEARARFQEALRLDDACGAAHLHLGDMENAVNRTQEAVEHWKRLAFDQPAEAHQVFQRPARAFFEMGHVGEVLQVYGERVDRTPRDDAAPALLALAEIHRRKGELDEAETLVQEAMDIAPRLPRAHRQWIRLALAREAPQAAPARLDRLLQTLEQQDPAHA